MKNTDSGPSDRQTLKSGEYPQVEDALYTWFLQERNRHTPISGEIIWETAKYLYKIIMKKDDFSSNLLFLIILQYIGPIMSDYQDCTVFVVT